MKKYILTSLVALVFVVSINTPAQAATIEELQAMIRALTAQITALSQQGGTFDVDTTNTTLTQNLTVGSRGEQVVALQNFLMEKGFLNIPSGLAKGYFGQLTKSAVIRYQTATGLSEKDGYVGPVTRQKINAMLDGHDVSGDVGTNDLVTIDYNSINTLSKKPTISGYAYNLSKIGISIGDAGGKAWGSGDIIVSNNRWSVFVDHEFAPGEYPLTVSNRSSESSSNVVLKKAVLKVINSDGNLVISNVAGRAAGDFEIDLNSTAYVKVNGIGTDPSAIKVYVGGFESTVTQASGDYLYFKTPTDGLVVGSSYDLYVKKGNQQSNTVKVKVISKVTIVIEPNEPLRIKSVQRAYDSRVTILPNGEELLFAVGVEANKTAYANALEVRFKKVSGSGNFNDYVSKISLVDWANRAISTEDSVSYDGDTTIYKFTKLAHKIYNSDGFYVKIKAKSDMDKSGQFTMTVPKDGLRVGDTTYVSGVVTNTITFDPTYTLKKNTTTAQESYVKITSPNNGGTYLYDESVDIRYETNLDNTNSEGITIQLFKTTKERGAIWQPVLTIATGLKDGKYTWKIPRTLPEGEYNIYVVGQGVLAGGQSVGDYTDKSITIKARPGM